MTAGAVAAIVSPLGLLAARHAIAPLACMATGIEPSAQAAVCWPAFGEEYHETVAAIALGLVVAWAILSELREG